MSHIPFLVPPATPLPDPNNLSPVEYARLCAAVDAVRVAAAVCRRVQQSAAIGERAKADRSPVTIADYASQALVHHKLETALGRVTLVAEEDPEMVSALGAEYVESVVSAVRTEWPEATASAVERALAGGAGRPSPDGFWTLDPVDGTKGFLRNEQYAIALAYVENGRPTLGVLGCPNLACDPTVDPVGECGTGILCFAIEGHGAFELDLAAPSVQPRRLAAASSECSILRACMSVERAHGNASGAATIMSRMRVPSRPVALDSQSKYAVVARGQADVYLRLPSSADYVEWIWDHAAGALVATESGCTVTDVAGRPLDFGQGRRLEANRGVLCAAAAWHQPLLDACRSVLGHAAPGNPS